MIWIFETLRLLTLLAIVAACSSDDGGNGGNTSSGGDDGTGPGSASPGGRWGCDPGPNNCLCLQDMPEEEYPLAVCPQGCCTLITLVNELQCSCATPAQLEAKNTTCAERNEQLMRLCDEGAEMCGPVDSCPP